MHAHTHVHMHTRAQPPTTHTHKPVCEHEDVTVLWNQGVHTDREVMANRPQINWNHQNSNMQPKKNFKSHHENIQ
jgi:hypothetical protein